MADFDCVFQEVLIPVLVCDIGYDDNCVGGVGGVCLCADSLFDGE